MSDIIKITNLSCTYVEKLRNNNTFFKNEFLLSGVFYVNLYTYDIYKTLLNFSLPLVDVDNIKKISLNIFLNNIRVYNNMQANFKISTLTSPFMGYTANWNNRPEINNFNSLNFSVNPSDVGKYMELDITYIIKNTNNNFYGIALESSQEKYTSMLQFLSSNSVNPPYITIETVSNKVNTAPENTDKIVTNIPTEISKNLPSKNTIENSIDTSMLTDLKTSVEDLNTKYSSLESLVKATADNIPVPQASDTNSELSSKISNLEEKLDAFNDIINTLKLNDDILKNTLNENDETIASIVNHLAEIEVKEKTALNDVKELSEKVNTTFTAINNQLLSLKTTSSSSSDLQTLKNDLEKTSNSIKSLENSLSVMNNEISELKTQYDSIKSQLNVISIDTIN
nr:DNRLRE domain-containing protein [uncultured Clostridium sp.]